MPQQLRAKAKQLIMLVAQLRTTLFWLFRIHQISFQIGLLLGYWDIIIFCPADVDMTDPSLKLHGHVKIMSF